MKFLCKQRPSAIFWPLALLGLVISTGFTKIANFDIWWHLKTGEIISLTGKIPKIDIFSYTAVGKPWINHEWLFQVFVWNALRLLGIASLTVIKLTIIIVIAIAAFKTIELLVKSKSAAIWGTAFILIAIADRVLLRPYLFSWMFLSYFALQLHGFETSIKKNLWELPLITLVWINLHGGGILAPQLVLSFALGESIQFFFSKRFNDAPDAISKKRIIHLWTVGVLCIAACIYTPHGIATLIFPMTHMGMGSILRYTQEWLPFFDPRLDDIVSQILTRITLITIIISYVVNRKSVRVSHLIITVITALMLLKGRRFTAQFVILNIPILFFNFKDLASKIPVTPGIGHLRTWGNIIAVGMISVLALRQGIPATLKGGFAGDFGLGTVYKFHPAAVDFLEAHDIHGKVFNEMGLGSYFLFRRWPRDLVFIDGRTPIYGDDFFLKYITALRHPKNFEELDEEYKFDYLVFNSYQAWNLRNMHKYFWYEPKWKLIFANQHGLIYLRDIPRHKELIDEYELKINPLIEEMRKNGEIGNEIVPDIEK